jgi:hypothetical protein
VSRVQGPAPASATLLEKKPGGELGGLGWDPTFTAGDTKEGLRVCLAHAVYDVHLLQCPLHGVLVLGVAGYIRRPELGTKGEEADGPAPPCVHNVRSGCPGVTHAFAEEH